MIKKAKYAILLLLLTVLFTSCTESAGADAETPPSQDETNQEAPEIIDSEDELSEEEKARIELEKKIAEREELEKQRKEDLKEFYVPLLPLREEREKKTIEVKALYVTGHTAGNELNKEN
ncbi:MAG: hypothetical protein GX243_05405, partial [Tissierellia bacterium]|nr:hypothetical protein [Tissierellia bacterium]